MVVSILKVKNTWSGYEGLTVGGKKKTPILVLKLSKEAMTPDN